MPPVAAGAAGSIVSGTGEGADSAPSTETSTTGPLTAVRGTRASTHFLCGRSAGTETSSAPPAAPWKTTESTALRARPLTRTREPARATLTPAQAVRQISARSFGGGPACAPPVGAVAAVA